MMRDPLLFVPTLLTVNVSLTACRSLVTVTMGYVDPSAAMKPRYTSSTTYSWSYPSTILLIPPIVLTLQSSCLFIHTKSQALPYIRKAILPLALYTIWYSCSLPDHSFFHPMKDFVHLNTVIQLSKFWACMRSVEFAFSDPSDYKWIGYKQVYKDSKDPTDRGKDDAIHVNGYKMPGSPISNEASIENKQSVNAHDGRGSPVANPSHRTPGTFHPILLGWLNLCSL
jgi:hypothetical protein